jgi:predicted anti-sigma-YlaC factor YlaD
VICPTEFQCSTYADGGLPDDEARRLEQHLGECGACRRLVTALQAERYSLMQCFQHTQFLEFELDELDAAPEEAAVSSPATRVSLLRFATVVLAIATLLGPALNALADLELPDMLDWLNPFSASGLMTLLINAAAYIVPDLITGFDSLLNNLSLLVFGAVMLTMVMLLVRRSAVAGALLSVIALLTVFSSSSFAMDVRRGGNQPVTVPPGETVDDTLVAFGTSVDVDGTVNGDVIAFARRVNIRGTVKGSVISFGQQVEVEGTVEGSVVGMAQAIRASGQIAKNLYAFGQEIMMGTKGRVAGNLAAFSAVSNIDGNIGRDLMAFGGSTDIHGEIARNVFAWSRVLSVLAPAHIGGNLTAHVRQRENVHVDTGAKVDGKTDIEVAVPPPSRYSTLSFYIWQIIWVCAAFLTGMVAFWLFPALARVNLDTGNALLIATGLGFLGVIVPPIAAIISSITLIGLPLGLITLVAWVVAGYLAKIIIAVFLGRSLLAGRDAQAPPLPVMLLAGLVPIFVAINLPFVGGLINFLLVLLGLGALLKTIYDMPRWRAQAA